MSHRLPKCLAALLSGLLATFCVKADVLTLAVAANFSAPMAQIEKEFEATTRHQLEVSVGSTGRFYAQIRNGAPFDILLAADASTPEKLANEGLALADSRTTYAIGTLVLYSQNPTLVDPEGKILEQGNFSKIALADPTLAPYGRAALQTLEALGLAKTLEPKFVFGESIGQAWQFVSTGNAALGFVASAQINGQNTAAKGSSWVIPRNLYAPLLQDAVILKRAKDKAAARELMTWLRSPQAIKIITAFGYETQVDPKTNTP